MAGNRHSLGPKGFLTEEEKLNILRQKENAEKALEKAKEQSAMIKKPPPGTA